MTEYNAGDAKLRIVPDARGFEKELKAKLDAMNVDFKVKVELQIAQAKADMDRFRRENDEKTINQRVNPQLSRAREELAAFRAEQRQNAINVPVKVDQNIAQNAGKTAGASAASGFAKEFEKAGKEVGNILKGLGSATKTMGLTALVASAPAAISSLVQVTQAVEQLAGAALVVPGAIGGLVASFGTLAIGVSGVKDAYGALSAASTESGQTQAATANATGQAQQSLKYAVEDEAKAQRDVSQARKDSRRSLEDLNIALRGGHISEEQAINDANKARRDLAKGGFKDALDYKDAQLRVQEADQRVVESRQSNLELLDKTTTANAKGVEGSDQVVAAKQAESRALDAVANAQQALTTQLNYGDAAQAKAQEMLKKLSPQAAEFVQTLVGLGPQWRDFQKMVSGNLFEGLGGSFSKFFNGVLPNFRTGLGAISSALNANIKQVLASLGSDSNKGILDRILGNTGEAQRRFTTAIDPLIRGLGVLTAAGSDSLPRLATAFGDIATKFANFIDAADKDGRLKGWIDAGLKGFTDLGNILLNLGESFHIIDAALGGEGLLGTLRNATEKLKTFLGSTEGQQGLKKFFIEARDELDKWRPIVKDLIQILPAVWAGAKAAADVFFPILKTIGDELRAHPGLVAAIVTAFSFWKGISAISDMAKGIGNLTNLFGKGGKGGGGLLGKIALVLEAMKLLDRFTGGGDAADPNINENAQNDTSFDRPEGGQDVIGNAITGGTAAAVAAPGIFKVPAAIIGGGYEAASTAVENGEASVRDRQNKEYEEWSKTHPYVPPTVSGPGIPQQLRDMLTAGRLKGFMLTPDGRIFNTDTQQIVDGVPGFADGGPTTAGLAMLHDNEFVLSAKASKYPDSMKHAMNEGRLGFADGGEVPHLGTGAAPGPADGGAATPPSFGFGSQVMSGLSGLLPFGNMIGPNAVQGGGLKFGMPTGLAEGDPAAVGAAKDFVTGQLSTLAVGTGKALFSGALDSVGLSGSILSPDNVYNKSIASLVGGGGGGDIGGAGAGTEGFTVGGGDQISLPNYGTSSGSGGIPGLSPTGAGNKGLQINTLKGKAIIESVAPWATNIGGVRADALKWHPSGLALDVMIPGAGGLNDPTPAEGKAEGDKLYAYLNANKEALGIDYMLWQQKDHFNHIHVNFAASGYPDATASGGIGSGAMITPPGSVTAGNAQPLRGNFGAAGWAPVVDQALAAVGPRYGITNTAAWKKALLTQIQTESGGNPNIDNPNDSDGKGGSQKVYGLGQFLPSTFAAHNITGGDIHNGTAQVYAMIDYVAKQYGQDPTTGVPKWIGQGVGYAYGGGVHGVGTGDTVPAMLTPGEHVLTTKDVAALGGQGGVYSMRNALHLAEGGDIADPNKRRNLVVPPRPNVGPLLAPSVTASQPAAPVVPDAAPAPVTPSAQDAGPAAGPAGPPPGGQDHNAPGIGSAIAGASSAAASAGSLIPGIGGAIGGGVAAAGKIVEGLLNVGSSFLVGSLGDQSAPGAAYGATYRPQQKGPQTAPTAMDHSRNYTFNGIDGRNVVDDLRLKDAQDGQAVLARW